MKALRALGLILLALHLTVVAAPRSEAASACEIDADVNATLHSFERQILGSRELAIKAAGMLVFPSVVKAGILDLAANMVSRRMGAAILAFGPE